MDVEEKDRDERGEDFAFQNTPPNYVKPLKDYSRESLFSIRGNLTQCYNNVDLDSSMHHIRRLSNYLDLKYSISRGIRVELTKNCWNMLFEFPIDHEQQIQIMQCIHKLIKREHLSTHGLTLEWKPLYNLVKSSHYSGNGVRPAERSKILQNHEQALTELIKKARSYFKEGSINEILNELLPYLNPFDIYYTFGISMMDLFIPTKQHWVKKELINYKIANLTDKIRNKYDKIPDFILFLLDQGLNEQVWTKGAADAIFALLARINKDNRGIFNVEVFLPEFFHFIYASIGFPISRQYCPIRASSRLSGGGFATHTSGLGSGSDYSLLCNLLVYCMDNRGDNDPIQLYFIEFFDKIKNYVYPDEQRRTSMFSVKFSSFLGSFATAYVARYWKELRGYNDLTLNNEIDMSNELKELWNWHSDVDSDHPLYKEIPKNLRLKPSQKLLNVLLPILKWCIYAKSMSVKMTSLRVIQAFSSIYPKLILEWAMPEVEECLVAVTESHRLNIGISLLGAITKTMLNNQLLPGFQKNLPKFLKAVLFGIDPSLTQQTMTTLFFYDAIFARVPFIAANPKFEFDGKKFNGGSSNKKVNDKAEMVDDGINPLINKDSEYKMRDENDGYARDATNYFEEFSVLFIEKIIDYSKNISVGIDSLKNSASQNDTAGIKNLDISGRNSAIVRIFERTMKSFWQCISKSIYMKCSEKVIESIIKSPIVGGLHNRLLLTMLSAYPQYSIPIILPQIVNNILEFDENGTKSSNLIDINKFDFNRKYKLKGSKSVLMYYFELLEAVLTQGHCYLVSYIPVISKIINCAITHEFVEIQRFSGALIESTVGSLVREMPLEFKPFSNKIWNNFDRNNNNNNKYDYWQHWNEWGLYTELECHGLKQGWRPKLYLDWYYPTEYEFNALQLLMNLTLEPAIESINQFVNTVMSYENNANGKTNTFTYTAEQTMQYIGLIFNFMYGLGHLGDFNQTIEDKEMNKNYEPSERYLSLENSKFNVPLYYYAFPTNTENLNNKKCDIYKELIKLRNMLQLPLNKQDSSDIYRSDNNNNNNESITLRTALTKLCVRWLNKCNDVKWSNENTNVTKKQQVGGIGKVIFWLSKLGSILLNQEGVNWSVVSNIQSNAGLFVNASNFSPDNPNGLGKDTRIKWINEEVALHYRRVYQLFDKTVESSDCEHLFEALRVASMTELDNVRLNCIASFGTARCIINFQRSMRKTYEFYIEQLTNNKAEKHELFAACDFFQNTALVAEAVCLDMKRAESFLTILMECYQHREPLVQESIHKLYMKFMRELKFVTLHVSTNLCKNNEARQKEITMINANLRKDYLSLMNTLVNIALKFNDTDMNKESSANIQNIIKESTPTATPTSVESSNNGVTTLSTSTDSFVHVTTTSTTTTTSTHVNDNSEFGINPSNDPVVESLSSLLSSLDLSSLKIDFNKLKNLKMNKESILSFLSQQGINLPSSVMEDLTDEQIQALFNRTGIPQRITQIARQKSTENDDTDMNKLSTLNIPMSKFQKSPKTSNNNNNNNGQANTSSHWRYQLMASVLLVRFMRSDIAPSQKIVEYILSLLQNDVRSLKRVGICGLLLIFGNNLPLLHFKHLIKDVSKYPNDNHFILWNKKYYPGSITSNNIGCDTLPLFLGKGNKEYLDIDCALYLKEYLDNSDNMNILLKAFENDHPRMPEPGTSDNRRRRSDKSDNIIALLSFKDFWPYDGYGIQLNYFERNHVILIRDILRTQWPLNSNDYHYQSNNTNLLQWNENLWKLIIKEYENYCNLTYNKNKIDSHKDKERQLVATELFAGIIRATHHFSGINQNPLNKDKNNWKEFEENVLIKQLSDITMKCIRLCPTESEPAWISSLHVAISNSDPQYTQWISNLLVEWCIQAIQNSGDDNTENKENSKENKETPDRQMRSLQCVNEIILANAFRGEKDVNLILKCLLNPFATVMNGKDNNNNNVNYDIFDTFFCNEYKNVRENFASLFACLIRALRKEVTPVFEGYNCLSNQVSKELKYIIETVLYQRFIVLWNDSIEEQSKLQAAVTANILLKNDKDGNNKDGLTENESKEDDGVDDVIMVGGSDIKDVETIFENSKIIEDENPKTRKLNRFLQTICFIVGKLLTQHQMVFFSPILVKLLPIILAGQYRKEEYTQRVTNYTANVLAWAPYTKEQVSEIFEYLLVTNLNGDNNNTNGNMPKLLKSNVWNTRKLVFRFLVLFVARNSYQMSEKHFRLLLDYICDVGMKDSELKVRIEARNVLITLIQSNKLFANNYWDHNNDNGMIDMTNIEQYNIKTNVEIENLINKFNKLSRTKLPKSKLNSKNDDANNDSKFDESEYFRKLETKLAKKHSGILGYSALILSYPYTLPHWMPECVSFLTNFERDRVPISTTVKAVIGEFKRTHRDEWDTKFKKQFTQAQLDDIRDVSSIHSYFV